MTFTLGALLLVGGVVYFVLHPVLTGREAPLVRSVDERTEAEARRRVALLALRDAEQDHATGKLDDADYRELRMELSGEALAALEAVEREAAGAGVPGPPELEDEIRRAREGLRSGLACEACGHLNPAGSAFCSTCGGGLAPSASGAE